MKVKKTSGFTLIELMVVVIVIAVLAAIALPSYLNQTRKSRRNAAEATVQQIALLEERYRADNPTYLAAPTSSSTNWSKLGSYPGSKYYSYAVTVAASTSVTPATYTVTVSGLSTQVKDRSNGTSCATLIYGTTTTGTISKTPADCW